MAIYPQATWHPVAGHTDGPMRSHTGAVLHVNQSDGNLYNWVAGDNNMSCHFEVYKDGTIEQYLDTSDSSWCQMSGNADYISIETEGYDTEPLTGQQCAAIAGLLRWLNKVHGIPLVLAEQPGEPGFGWHGMGGAAWGGHTGCPGTLRRDQRAAIVRVAAGAPQTTPTPTTSEDDVKIVQPPRGIVQFPLVLGMGDRPITLKDQAKAAALAAAGVPVVTIDNEAHYKTLRLWAGQ